MFTENKNFKTSASKIWNAICSSVGIFVTTVCIKFESYDKLLYFIKKNSSGAQRNIHKYYCQNIKFQNVCYLVILSDHIATLFVIFPFLKISRYKRFFFTLKRTTMKII